MKSTIQKATLLLCFLLGVHFSIQAQDDKPGEFHLDKTYSINAGGTLYMNPSDAKIKMIGSDRSDVHIKIDRKEVTKGFSSGSREFNITVENKGGDLHLTEKRKGSWTVVGYSRVEYDILIELPEGVSIAAKSDDSDYQISNVNGSIDIKLDDGDIDLRNCNGNSFEFGLDDGDLRMDGGSGDLYARLDDGDAEISGGDFKEVEMSVDDGSIFLETSLQTNGDYSIRSDDARIEFVALSGGGSFVVLKDDSSLKTSDDFQTIEISKHRAEFALPGGNAKVKIKTDDGRVRLSSGSKGL